MTDQTDETEDFTIVKCDNPECGMEMVPLTGGELKFPCLMCGSQRTLKTEKRSKQWIKEFFDNL